MWCKQVLSTPSIQKTEQQEAFKKKEIFKMCNCQYAFEPSSEIPILNLLLTKLVS